MSKERQEHYERQREQQAEGQAMSAATQAAARTIDENIQNPQFFQQLRDADIDSQDFDWLESEIGPELSGSHLIGNRDEDYEQEVRWLTPNSAERTLAEGTPGRLCRGSTLKIAQGVHGRDDKDMKRRYTSDERRAVRGGFEAAANYKSLAVRAQGLKSVTQATAVSRVEKEEPESDSWRERASRFLG